MGNGKVAKIGASVRVTNPDAKLYIHSLHNWELQIIGIGNGFIKTINLRRPEMGEILLFDDEYKLI